MNQSYIDQEGIAHAIVLKLGTNSVVAPDGTFYQERLERIASEIVALRTTGIYTFLISSGSIRTGMFLKGYSKVPDEPVERQVCASIGQPKLTEAWQNAFGRINVAQLLYTFEDLRHDADNIADVVYQCMADGDQTLVNYNDSANYREIDADNESTAVSCIRCLGEKVPRNIQVEGLVIMTDQYGLMDKGSLVEEVTLVDQKVLDLCNGTNGFGKGGMKSKLIAGGKCLHMGAYTIIGHQDLSLNDLLYNSRRTIIHNSMTGFPQRKV